MGSQRDGELGLSEEIEEDRKHLLFEVEVLLKTGQVDDVFEFLSLFVAEVRQQAVIVVADHRRQKAVELVVSDLDVAVDHGVADDAFPYIVVDLV